MTNPPSLPLMTLTWLTVLSAWLHNSHPEVPHLPIHGLCWQQPSALLLLIELQCDLVRVCVCVYVVGVGVCEVGGG